VTRRGILLLIVTAALAAACSSSKPSGDDPEEYLAVVVRSMGAVGNSANFEVSIANVSSETFKIHGVAVNPGVPRDMYGLPVTTPFTLEPGQEHTVIAEMRLLPKGLAEWPDILAVEISWERSGRNGGHTYRVNVLPNRNASP
jgi:hypothetical protein